MQICRYLSGLAVVCALATGPANAQQRLNYTGQTDVNLTVSYAELPAGTQLFYLNRTSGVKWAALVPLVSGSGSMSIPMPAGPGHYAMVAWEGGQWVAETVVFYAEDPQP